MRDLTLCFFIICLNFSFAQNTIDSTGKRMNFTLRTKLEVIPSFSNTDVYAAESNYRDAGIAALINYRINRKCSIASGILIGVGNYYRSLPYTMRNKHWLVELSVPL